MGDQTTKTLQVLSEIEVEYMAAEGYYTDEGAARHRKDAFSVMHKWLTHIGKVDLYVPIEALNIYDRFMSRKPPPPDYTRETKTWIVMCCLKIAWEIKGGVFPIDDILKKADLKPLACSSTEGKNQDIEDVYKEGLRVREEKIREELNGRISAMPTITFFNAFTAQFRDNQHRMALRREALNELLRIVKDIKITQFRPSTVAATAFLAAVGKLHPGRYAEFKEETMNSPYVHNEDLLRCMEATAVPPEKQPAASSPDSKLAQPPPEPSHSMHNEDLLRCMEATAVPPQKQPAASSHENKSAPLPPEPSHDSTSELLPPKKRRDRDDPDVLPPKKRR